MGRLPNWTGEELDWAEREGSLATHLSGGFPSVEGGLIVAFPMLSSCQGHLQVCVHIFISSLMHQCLEGFDCHFLKSNSRKGAWG